MPVRSLTLALALTALTALAPLPGSAETTEVDLGVGRLVLVPLNLGVLPKDEVKDGVEPVWQEILHHFGNGERRVTALERTSASALWNEVMVEIEASGNRDVYEAYSLFAQRIAEQVDYGRIVFPSLVVRAARLQGSSAGWDGVRQKVDSPLVGHETIQAREVPDMLVARGGLRGEIAAASLHVAVLDEQGELRFEGAGGLTVLQELVHGKVRGDAALETALRSDAFSDPEPLREGIEAAFRQPLPASRAH